MSGDLNGLQVLREMHAEAVELLRVGTGGERTRRFIERAAVLTTVCLSLVKAAAQAFTPEGQSPAHELGYALTCAERERDEAREALEVLKPPIIAAVDRVRLENEAAARSAREYQPHDQAPNEEGPAG